MSAGTAEMLGHVLRRINGVLGGSDAVQRGRCQLSCPGQFDIGVNT